MIFGIDASVLQGKDNDMSSKSVAFIELKIDKRSGQAFSLVVGSCLTI
jgi:hypothetical protein